MLLSQTPSPVMHASWVIFFSSTLLFNGSHLLPLLVRRRCLTFTFFLACRCMHFLTRPPPERTRPLPERTRPPPTRVFYGRRSGEMIGYPTELGYEKNDVGNRPTDRCAPLLKREKKPEAYRTHTMWHWMHLGRPWCSVRSIVRPVSGTPYFANWFPNNNICNSALKYI